MRRFGPERVIYVDRGAGMLHVWVGPVGVHLQWQLWRIRFDFFRYWRVSR